ncbi:MAG TPA: phosphate ABC transporter substrate-binding protein PstS family protein [Candidatus Limnocylindrales bacterium]|nr:phosphate ABC transporter substrate-binding protein PstS family protein [Candidatus Limnocylindrales bacterium]
MNLSRAALGRGLPVLAASALILGACGTTTGDGGNATADPTANGDGGVSGSVFVSGSSTVEPITALIAESFRDENPGFDFTVEGPGTGDGFALFCNGETDISDASRPIRDSEAEACADAGIEYTEILVAYDGLAVITSAQNEAVSCLSFADLYALLGPESQGFGTWSDANGLAAELPDGYGDVHAPYPDAELIVTAPGEESGTFDSFVEIVIGDLAEERGQDETTRPDYVASANDNVIIEGITGTPTSLGWVGLAFASENADTVKILEVDGGDGCVAPSDETVVNESYPIARPLFIYVNNTRAEQNPAVAAFVDYYVENLDAAGEVGYVNLSDEEMATSQATWQGR